MQSENAASRLPGGMVLKPHNNEIKPGDKVKYKDGRIYDFGYYSSPGFCVIYEEGERNMQDSYAVKLKDIQLANITLIENATPTCLICGNNFNVIKHSDNKWYCHKTHVRD